jgi:hypothetical protein
LLKQWSDRFQDENPRRREIQNRQALLDYSADPAASLAYLRERLGMAYNHQRITPDARPDLPTTLDPALISWEAYLATALSGTDNLGNLTASGLVTALRNGGIELPGRWRCCRHNDG